MIIDAIARAEHFWCVAVEGEAALSHGWELHRKQAAIVLARLEEQGIVFEVRAIVPEDQS
jgi:hypothetical protein